MNWYLIKAVPGDIVLDPMCGGGSIPLEGSLMNTGAFFLGRFFFRG